MTNKINIKNSFTHSSHETNPFAIPNNNDGFILYTLLILTTIGSIFFFTSLYTIRSTLHSTSNTVQRSQARDLAESGITRAEYFLNGGDGHSITWNTDSYVETFDSYGEIKISCQPYGFFSQIMSTGIRRLARDTVSGIVGRTAPQVLNHSLLLTNTSGGCLLVGNSKIKGTIILHHGLITDKPHGRRMLPDYENSLYSQVLPALPFDSSSFANTMNSLSKTFEEQLKSKTAIGNSVTFDNENDSLLLLNDIVINGDVFIDCHIKQKSITVRGKVTLSSKALCKNVFITAKKFVFDQALTEHSLFFSKEGISLKGGSHNSQFISTDSITISNQPSFGSTNCIITFRKLKNDTLFSGGIYVQSNIAIKGCLISCIDQGSKDAKKIPRDVSIRINPGYSIKGYIITDHDIDIQSGDIEGSLWARNISTTYNSMSYTNALIETTISELSEEIPFPLLGGLPLKIIVNR
jgi:hypothetical protein